MRLVLRHDRCGTLRFASLQGAFAAALIPRHPELVSLDSLVWVEPVPGGGERVLVRSAAVLRAAAYLGSWWRVFLAAWAVPRALRDAAYDLLARHRHRILGADGRCFLPPPAQRARFLDGA